MRDAATPLETLYRAIGPGLLAYLRRLVRDHHAAEDLLQETFLQAARRVDRLRQTASPRAWLFTIARRVAITALRRRRPTQRLVDEPETREPHEDPRVDLAQRVLHELPEATREVLDLRLRHDLTYEEIAAVLGIPVGTVRSRLHYAVRRLRDAAAAANE